MTEGQRQGCIQTLDRAMRAWVDRARPVMTGRQDNSLHLLFTQQLELYSMIQELRLLVTDEPLGDDVPVVVFDAENERYLILDYSEAD